jgi:hypothetical protein
MLFFGLTGVFLLVVVGVAVAHHDLRVRIESTQSVVVGRLVTRTTGGYLSCSKHIASGLER